MRNYINIITLESMGYRERIVLITILNNSINDFNTLSYLTGYSLKTIKKTIKALQQEDLITCTGNSVTSVNVEKIDTMLDITSNEQEF